MFHDKVHSTLAGPVRKVSHVESQSLLCGEVQLHKMKDCCTVRIKRVEAEKVWCLVKSVLRSRRAGRRVSGVPCVVVQRAQTPVKAVRSDDSPKACWIRTLLHRQSGE